MSALQSMFSVSKVRSIDKIRMYQNNIAEKIVTAYMIID